jgi:hypothetical protein
MNQMSKISDFRAQKYALKRASVEAKHQLISELDESKQKAADLLQTAAIVGGSLTVGYLIFRALVSGRNKTVSEPKVAQAGVMRHAFRRRIKQRILQELTLYLLRIAKEELLKHLGSRREEDNNDTGEITE